MADYIGVIKKSRTLDLAALTGMAGAALTVLPQLQGLLSEKHYGIALLILSVWQGYLRTKTNTALGDK